VLVAGGLTLIVTAPSPADRAHEARGRDVLVQVRGVW
jgi:hypothetical protein